MMNMHNRKLTTSPLHTTAMSHTLGKKLGSVALAVLLAVTLCPYLGFADQINTNTAAQESADAKQPSAETINVSAPLLNANAPKTVTITFKDSVLDLTNNPMIEIDGVPYRAYKENGAICITVPMPQNASSAAHFATYYQYKKNYRNSPSVDDQNTNYPTAMYVWELSYSANKAPSYTAKRLTDFDNILKYAGCSVRTSDPHGIRLVTSIPSAKKSKLINNSLAGYTLQESGTIVQWTEKIDAAGLTYQATSLKGKAYNRKSGKDPVYKSEGGQEKYTNVLTGFTDAQCKPLLSLRPYLLLSKNGKSFYLYGGTVTRSIGYIASQNTDVFLKGTAGYKFIWNMVHAAYGSSLDKKLNYVNWDIRQNVSFYNQAPELPSGCESVAATNCLNGYGFNLGKTVLYDNYLTFSSWDFVHAFMGDGRILLPGGSTFPPAITDAINRFLVTQDVRERAHNITGSDFSTLISYVDQGYPVILWSTTNMCNPSGFGPTMEGYTLYNDLHCVTMYGHKGTSKVYVSDSVSGNVTRDYSAFASLYYRCGKNAIVIL